jgi:DNA-directed RNA polymerase subunit RPC12/RpoP
MGNSVNRIKGDLSYNRIYRCCDCGVGAVGDTESTSIDTFGHEGVAEHLRCIERSALNPHHMPVGWVSYGDDIYRCTNCKKKREANRDTDAGADDGRS